MRHRSGGFRPASAGPKAGGRLKARPHPLVCVLVLSPGLLLAQAGDWRTLFDGRSFEGWRGPHGGPAPREYWAIEDDTLRTLPSDFGRDIFTAESFRDYELGLEWKIAPGGNSGIFYNLLDVPKPPLHTRWWYERLRRWSGWHVAALVVIALVWVRIRPRRRGVILALLGLTLASAAYFAWFLRGRYVASVLDAALGLEMQVLDDQGHPDAKVGPHRRAGALYDQLAPSHSSVRAAGEWNQVRLVVKGAHVEHWLNGEKIVEFEIGSPDFRRNCAASKFAEICDAWSQKRSTPIALQHHHDLVWYRNIRIRQL